MTHASAGTAALAIAVALVAVSCGGSARSARSAPPTSAAATHPRLHLVPAGASSSPTHELTPRDLLPLRPTKYVLDGPLADLGATASVRRLVADDITDADVRHLADLLGLDAGSVTRTTNGYVVTGADATLTVSSGSGTQIFYTSGANGAVSSGGSGGASTEPSGPVPPSATDQTSASTVPAATTPSTAPPGVPDAATAQSIARALLDRLGVLGTDQWRAEVSDGAGVAVACAAGVPCPTVPPIVFSRTVTLQRVVDGVEVNDAGWSVTLGAHARVESLSGMWASLGDLGAYRLRATRDVFTDLQDGKARFVGPQPMTALGAPAIATPLPSSPAPAVVVHVTGVSLGYATWYAYDGTNERIDLVPTYRFRARADGGVSYDIELLALDPSGFDIVNPSSGASIPKVTPEPAPAPAP